MSLRKTSLKFFLDEGVPVSVGRTLEAAGHSVILLQNALPKGSPDPLVCAAAEANDSILVAHDGDMRKMAQSQGIGQGRFKKLSLIKLSCRESQSADRVNAVMSLIEHEWSIGGNRERRVFIDIATDVIRVYR